jgi:DNA-directed RNA polymerase subunit RPC12/RpoP
MTLVPLKCTECGGKVNRETLTCEYCGASFILKDESTVIPRKIISCPECKQSLPIDSIICLNCGKILTDNEKEIKKLEYFKEQIELNQWVLKEKLKELPLEKDEYILNFYGYGNLLWVVTDKRLLIFEKRKKRVEEIKYDEIVRFYDFKPYVKRGFFMNSFIMDINIETFKGMIAWLHIELPVSDFLSPQFYEQQATMVQNLYISSVGAFLASEGKTKIPEVILYRLKLKK